MNTCNETYSMAPDIEHAFITCLPTLMCCTIFTVQLHGEVPYNCGLGITIPLIKGSIFLAV
jgi:hypothetical protein